MRRLLILAAIALPALPALAQRNPAQCVSLDHWAYDAMQRLMDLGVTSGFPDGTFSGNRPLTRYEFAAAVTRTLDGFATRSGGPDPEGALDREEIGAILARLEAEFATEIAELRGPLDYGFAGDRDRLARVTHPEESMDGPRVIAWLEDPIGLPDHLDAEYGCAYVLAATGIPDQIRDNAPAGPR